MRKIVQGSPEKSFWEQNVEIELLPQCQNLIREHGTELSSVIAWVSYLVFHPESTLVRTIVDHDNRYEVIKGKLATDIPDTLDEFYTAYEKEVDSFLDAILSKGQKLYRRWEDELDRLTANIAKESSVKNRITYMLNVDKISEALDKARDYMLAEEKNSATQMYGKGHEGYAERRARQRKAALASSS